jgi:hypothetical protein
MTTRTSTCTVQNDKESGQCGGNIHPSYIDIERGAFGEPKFPQGELTHPAACETCGTTYPDILSIPMTRADLELIGQRLSESTREELQALATELLPGSYEIEMTEERARDLAAKAANLGLPPIANKIRQELNGLTSQRRKP